MAIFQSLAFLAFASHLRTMFTDPVINKIFNSLIYRLDMYLLNLFNIDWYIMQGAVPKGNATKEMIQQMGFREGQVIFKCPKCCSIKPDRAHHCSVCQR